MAQPVWKGDISFGLVNIPVALYSAEKHANLHFQLLDSRNEAKVRYQRINEETGEEVPWDKVVKGYEYEDGNYVVISEDELREAGRVEGARAIELESFVELARISPVYFERPYFLVPQERGEKGYVLLCHTLAAMGRAGIGRVVIRNRQHLAAIMAYEQTLVLMLLRYPGELRHAEEFNIPQGELKAYRISDKEVEMATQLVEAMTSAWQPAQYHDETREVLMSWIEEKLRKGRKHRPAKAKTEPTVSADVIDLSEQLRKSVQSRKTKAESSAARTPAKRSRRSS